MDRSRCRVSETELGFRMLALLAGLVAFLLGLIIRALRQPPMRIRLWQVPLPCLAMLLLWWWFQLPVDSLYVMLGMGALVSGLTYAYYRLVEARR